MKAAERERVLERIREICLGLPETSERLSHGAPTFFVREKRSFLMVLTDHHGDGRFAIWCAAAEGTQGLLVEADPERFFRPPYVGHRGWLGVRLDRGLDWDELAGIAEDAYAEVAPAKLVEAARARGRRREGSTIDRDGARASARRRGLVRAQHEGRGLGRQCRVRPLHPLGGQWRRQVPAGRHEHRRDAAGSARVHVSRRGGAGGFPRRSPAKGC